MRFGSVCSGIEAASAAWEPLGWQSAFFSEIDQFPCSVLAHHYPGTPNHGDMTKFKEWPDANINVLVGGTPCQSFSVAGLRKGLDDPRGNLMLTFGAIAAKYRPEWLVWENVPGVLSSNSGRDFGTFLGMLGQLGYGFAYRVLDAQYFGVAKRRRRVFAVARLGDWRGAAAVLFERHSLSGNPAPSREAREEVAGTLESSIGRSRGAGTSVAAVTCCPTLRAGGNSTGGDRPPGTDVDTCESLVLQSVCVTGNITHTLKAAGFDGSEDGTGRGQPIVAQTYRDQMGLEHWLDTAVSVHGTQDPDIQNDQAHTLGCNSGQENAVLASAMRVRRLTPRECERLQGFPDGYTLVPHRGKPVADGPRYKALGNSMAVPVMAWIGSRIQEVTRIAE